MKRRRLPCSDSSNNLIIAFFSCTTLQAAAVAPISSSCRLPPTSLYHSSPTLLSRPPWRGNLQLLNSGSVDVRIPWTVVWRQLLCSADILCLTTTTGGCWLVHHLQNEWSRKREGHGRTLRRRTAKSLMEYYLNANLSNI